MIVLTTKFLHLFLVLLALGSIDNLPWLESKTHFGHGAHAAPTSNAPITASSHETSQANADGDTSAAASAPASRRGSLYVRRPSTALFEEDNASRRGSFLARRASVYTEKDDHSRRNSVISRRASVFAEPGDLRRGSVVARRASAFTQHDVSRRGSTGAVSLPLEHFDTRDPANAQLNLQHQLNRANVKLANMRRRAPPTEEELKAALERRKRSLMPANADGSDLFASPFDKRAKLGKFEGSSPRFPSNHGSIAKPDPLANLSASREGRRALSSQLPRSEHVDDFVAKKNQKDSHITKSQENTHKDGDDDTKSKKSTSQAPSYATSSDSLASSLLSDTLIQAAIPSAKDTLELAIESNNIGYVANVQIGSEGKTFKMLVDSGSADTWVPGAKCTSCATSQTLLTSKISSTLKTSSTSWSIQYGTGEVDGTLASDSMTIAGMKLSNYTFALASSESEDFVGAPFDGLMGLAQSKLANSDQPTPIEALYTAKKVNVPVMGYHLGDALQKLPSGEKQNGQVTFGGVDSSMFNGTLVEIDNVSSEGFYEIPIQGVSIDGKSISKLSSGRTSILDTGTSLMVAPAADAEAVHAQIPGAESDGQGGFTLPCNTTSILSFKLGGEDWPLLARDLVFQTMEGDSSTCVSSLSSGDVGQENEWLLGAVMIKRLYYATNAKDNVVGLGKLRQPAS